MSTVLSALMGAMPVLAALQVAQMCSGGFAVFFVLTIVFVFIALAWRRTT